MRVGEAIAALILGAVSLAPTSASAQWWSPAGAGAPVPVPSRYLAPLEVHSQPWNPASVTERYGNGADGGNGIKNTIATFVFGGLSGPTMDFDDTLRDQIVAGCRTFSEPARQLRCAAEAVDIAMRGRDSGHGRTFCYTRARGYMEVVRALGIPGVDVGFKWFATPGPHIVNTLGIVQPDGTRLEYIIDVGWNPERLWPHEEAARRFHDPNGDGVNENRALPTIGNPPPPAPLFRWPFGGTSLVGSNVSRIADTRVAGTAAVVRAASGAGVLRD